MKIHSGCQVCPVGQTYKPGASGEETVNFLLFLLWFKEKYSAKTKKRF